MILFTKYDFSKYVPKTVYFYFYTNQLVGVLFKPVCDIPLEYLHFSHSFPKVNI